LIFDLYKKLVLQHQPEIKMAETFVAQIVMFAGNFAPRGWAFCDGQLLNIDSNQSLFSVIGTTYGGDGRTTFQLPDLRGRFSMHKGNGPGLSPSKLGKRGGSERVTLTIGHLPPHGHQIKPPCNSEGGTDDDPQNSVNSISNPAEYSDKAEDTMKAFDSENTGGGQAVNIVNPFLCVNYIIATEGGYPS
jgi:microcystin-dependent protein